MTNETFFDRRIDFSSDFAREECFNVFDKGKKQFLNEDDLLRLVTSLLHKEVLEEYSIRDLFSRFDLDSDGKINMEEFANLWKNWIKPLLQPVTAFLIVDAQNDFIDGSLALKNCPAKQDGNEIIPIINDLIQKINFDVVVYSIDYHPENHISFFDNVENYKLSRKGKKEGIKLFDTVIFEGPPKVTQKLWPRHCVQETWGAQLHKDLKITDDSILLYKGQNPMIDSYSAFWDNNKAACTELHEELRKRHVTHVFVCGLAYEYCVAFTALDALELGYATVMVEDASKGTDENIMGEMREKLTKHSCVMANSTEIENIVKVKDIRMEFVHVLGKNTES